MVITSPSTWLDRHGPKAQRVWLKNSQRLDRLTATEANTQLQPEWKFGLDGCFEVIVINEAQLLQSLSAQTSIALQWLRAKMHVLVSATPMPNGITDWAGYTSFIEHPDAGQWWSEDSLEQMGFEEDMNPFDLPDDHPAAKLRLTKRAYKD